MKRPRGLAQILKMRAKEEALRDQAVALLHAQAALDPHLAEAVANRATIKRARKLRKNKRARSRDILWRYNASMERRRVRGLTPEEREQHDRELKEHRRQEAAQARAEYLALRERTRINLEFGASVSLSAKKTVSAAHWVLTLPDGAVHHYKDQSLAVDAWHQNWRAFFERKIGRLLV